MLFKCLYLCFRPSPSLWLRKHTLTFLFDLVKTKLGLSLSSTGWPVMGVRFDKSPPPTKTWTRITSSSHTPSPPTLTLTPWSPGPALAWLQIAGP